MTGYRELLLGPEAIGLMLPHRPPFLMVDGIEAARLDESRPGVRAFRCISANEPVFAGHFPGLALWPGVYTQEGMGQTSMLLGALLEMARLSREAGERSDFALEALARYHAAQRFEPLVAEEETRVRQVVATIRSHRVAPTVTAAVEMKFLHPVFAGDRLVYQSELGRVVGVLARFEVEAWVGSRIVARGVITGSMGMPAASRFE